MIMKVNETEIRALTTDELDVVVGGRKIDQFRNERALELLAKTEKWLASVGVDTMGGFGQQH
jgi:hypothetical protein